MRKKWVWRLVETDEVLPDGQGIGYSTKGVLPPVGPRPILRPADGDPPAPAPYVQHTPVPGLPKEVKTAEADSSLKALDHPYIGGKFTAFALVYGDHFDLARRCIDSILAKSTPDRLDLRIAANQPSKETLAYLQSLDKSRVTKLYIDRSTRRKYPAMREMFHDPGCPITTRYVLWFDDDTWVRSNTWLLDLTKMIVENHGSGCRIYGAKYLHDLMPYQRQGFRPDNWFKGATWWKNRPLWTANGHKEAPNGSQIVFASGGFWALAHEMIVASDIPDKRLNHNGGDVTLGEQVHQAGGLCKDFSRDKKIVCWSDAPRRGYREDFPWAKFKG